MSVVEFVGTSIGVPGFTQDQDIRITTERIRKDCTGPDVDVGIVPWSLTGRRTIKVPFRQFFVALDGPWQRLWEGQQASL